MFVDGNGFGPLHNLLDAYEALTPRDGANEFVVEWAKDVFVGDKETGLDAPQVDSAVVTACGGLEDSNRKGRSQKKRRFIPRNGRKLTMDELIGQIAEPEDRVDDLTEEPSPIAAAAWPSSFRTWRNRRVRNGVVRMLSRSLAASTLISASYLSTVAVRLLQTRGLVTGTRENRRTSGLNRRSSGLNRRRFPRP